MCQARSTAATAVAIAALLAVMGLVFMAWRNGGMVGVYLGMTMGMCG